MYDSYGIQHLHFIHFQANCKKGKESILGVRQKSISEETWSMVIEMGERSMLKSHMYSVFMFEYASSQPSFLILLTKFQTQSLNRDGAPI